MAPRKTAAQKAAEAAEREEYTGIPESSVEDTNAARQAEEEPESQDKDLSDVKDEKTGKALTVQQMKNKLRNEAEREVLDSHKDEVVKITAAKYAEHNLKYVRRLTDEEKAAKAIEEYYKQFPNLRPQLEQQQSQLDHDDANLPAQMEAERVERTEPGAHYEGEYEAPYVEPDYSEVE